MYWARRIEQELDRVLQHASSQQLRGVSLLRWQWSAFSCSLSQLLVLQLNSLQDGFPVPYQSSKIRQILAPGCMTVAGGLSRGCLVWRVMKLSLISLNPWPRTDVGPPSTGKVAHILISACHWADGLAAGKRERELCVKAAWEPCGGMFVYQGSEVHSVALAGVLTRCPEQLACHGTFQSAWIFVCAFDLWSRIRRLEEVQSTGKWV